MCSNLKRICGVPSTTRWTPVGSNSSFASKVLFSFNHQYLLNSFHCLNDSDRLQKVTEPLLSVISSTHSWSTSNLSFHISTLSHQEHIAHTGVTFATYIPVEKMNPKSHTWKIINEEFHFLWEQANHKTINGFNRDEKNKTVWLWLNTNFHH